MSESSVDTIRAEPAWVSSAAADRVPPRRITDEVLKRTLDILLAVLGIIVLSPLMLTVAILIRLTTRSAIIYAHRRVGRGGLPFDCFKFQSMQPMPDHVFAAYLESHPAAAEEWRTYRKLRNDPRVTPLGRVLRESSLDELPQLFNVLRGEMSFVGPRPIVYAELEHYGSVTLDYLSHRPGLTGLWQVSGRSELSYPERVAFDRQYVRRRSLGFDLLILGRTVPAVLRRGQAS